MLVDSDIDSSSGGGHEPDVHVQKGQSYYIEIHVCT